MFKRQSSLLSTGTDDYSVLKHFTTNFHLHNPHAQHFLSLLQTIQGNPDSEFEDHGFNLDMSPKRGRVNKKEDTDEKIVVRTKSAKGKKSPRAGSSKVVEESPAKRGRGRPKKSGDSFPYSEIKEIIEASKKTDTGKRGRGRPPKKLPPPSSTKSGSVKKVIKKAKETPIEETPVKSGRYSTRGIKRNYLDMSAGKVEIKKEVISDEEVESEEEEEMEEEIVSPRKRGRPRKNAPVAETSEVDEEVDEEEEEDEDDEFLDDFEQETQELDEDMEADYLDEDDIDNDEHDTTIGSLDGSKGGKMAGRSEDEETPGGRITDSVVKSLRTSNVSTSVPAIAKVGIRTVKVGKRKHVDDDEEEKMEKELEKAVEAANIDSLHCSLCDDHKAETFSDMTAHLKTFHHVYEPPRCDICEIDFDTVKRLGLHIDKKHGPQKEPAKFRCESDGCNKVFTSQVGLTGHVNKVHLGQPVKEKKYECEKCSFKTNSREDLWEHKKVDHNEEIECKPCSMVFVNYQTLKAHNNLKHSDDDQQICYYCGKEFSSNITLQRHLKFHSGQRFTCNICNKSMSTKASYQDHMERHKPERERKYKFYCTYCGKGFSVKSNYEDHQNKHTGNKPYKCNVCFKTFGFRSMLKKHKIFVHSSERPFKCGYCMKGFKFMNLLKNHVTIHTNKSRHVCSYCQKVFSTASTLKIHLKKCSMVNPNTIVMFTDAQLDPNTAANTITEQEQQIIVENAGNLLQSSAESVTNIVVSDPVTELQTENIILEDAGMSAENVGFATEGAPSEVEVYACSECNSTFASFQEAEAHILTSHPVGTA